MAKEKERGVRRLPWRLCLPAALLAGIAAFLLFPLLARLGPTVTVTVTATGESADWATNYAVRLRDVAVGHKRVAAPAAYVLENQGFFFEERENVHHAEQKDARLVLSLPRLQSGELFFDTGADCGYVTIEQGGRTQRHNLCVGEDGYVYRTPTGGFLAVLCAGALWLALAVPLCWLFARMTACRQGGARRAGPGARVAAALVHPLFSVLLLALLVRLVCFADYAPYTLTPDSASYLGVSLADTFRTPLYPAILRVFHLFIKSDVQMLTAVVWFQTAAALVAVAAFYGVARYLLPSRGLAVATTALYGCLPGVFNWEKLVLTESLGISGTVLCLWLLVRYLQKPSAAWALALGLCCTMLVLLRPGNLILVVILAVFWMLRCIMEKPERKKALAGIAGVGIAVLAMVGYATLNWQVNGWFVFSRVSTDNQVKMLVDENFLYESDEYPELVRLFEENKAAGEESWAVQPEDAGGLTAWRQDFVRSAIGQNFGEYVRYTLDNFQKAALEPFTVGYARWDTTRTLPLAEALDMLLPLTFFHVGLLLVWELGCILWHFFAQKKVLWLEAGLFSIVLATVCSAIVGTWVEYRRLVCGAVPLVLLLLAVSAWRLAGWAARQKGSANAALKRPEE